MRREIVPAEVIIPARPIPDGDWLARRLRGEGRSSDIARSMDVRGINTTPTSVAEADSLSRSLVRELDQAIRCGDRSLIWKMLRDRPELIRLPKFPEILCRWITNGSLRAPRGRPRGATGWCPLVVAGLIDQLVFSGVARNLEQAFVLLDPLGVPYDSAKRLYRQACREPRFRALMILDEGRARPVEDRDQQWTGSAEALSAGKTLVRSHHDPQLGGRVELQFRAT